MKSDEEFNLFICRHLLLCSIPSVVFDTQGIFPGQFYSTQRH